MGSKPGRNERCPCGSGRKYKVCCGAAPAARSEGPQPADAVTLHERGLACLRSGRVAEALNLLRRAISENPTLGRVHADLGLALQLTGDDEAAIAAYRVAIDRSPDLALAHARLGDALWEKGLRTEALAGYRRAATLEPGTNIGRIAHAMVSTAEDRPRDVEEELARVIESEPTNAKAHLMLGNLLQEAGRFDDADIHFERCIALAPWESAAYHALALSKRFTTADGPQLSRILSRLQSKDWHKVWAPPVAARHQMTLHFAAGKVLDDLGEFAAAMNHFRAANAIRRKFYPFNRAETERFVDQLIGRFPLGFFDRRTVVGHDDITPILVVGMPRSGTTLVERMVSSHPKVRGCGELDFWTERTPGWINAGPDKLRPLAEQLRTDYLHVLRGDSVDHLMATDKMPFNFLWLGFVHMLFPDARVLHARRNAIDTCLSLYMTQIGKTWGFVSALDDLAWFYRQYRRLMNHWRAVIPPDRLLDVDYETIVEHPEASARRTIAFCSLTWDSACIRPDVNRDAVKTASKWQARQPIYRTSVERWRHYEPWIGELLELRSAVEP